MTKLERDDLDRREVSPVWSHGSFQCATGGTNFYVVIA
jgi:hypothetical protein